MDTTPISPRIPSTLRHDSTSRRPALDSPLAQAAQTLIASALSVSGGLATQKTTPSAPKNISFASLPNEPMRESYSYKEVQVPPVSAVLSLSESRLCVPSDALSSALPPSPLLSFGRGEEGRGGGRGGERPRSSSARRLLTLELKELKEGEGKEMGGVGVRGEEEALLLKTRVKIAVPPKLLFQDYSRLKPLAEVNLSGWEIENSDIAALAHTHWHCLQWLDISACNALTPGALMPLTKCTGLLGLNATGCAWIEDEELMKLLPSLPRLACIDVTACTKLSNAFVCFVLENVRCLQQLFLSGLFLLDDGIAMAFQSRHKRREEKQYSAITHLDLAGMRNFTTSGIVTILTAVPSLAYLRMSDTRFEDAAFVGTDLGALQHLVFDKMPQQKLIPYLLESESHANANPVFGAVFATAAATPGLSSQAYVDALKSLGPQLTPKWTALSLQWILKAAPGLKELSLRYCTHLTNKGVGDILAACAGTIQRLDITGCENLGDEWLQAWHGHIKTAVELESKVPVGCAMHTFKMDYVPHITVRGVNLIPECMPQLRIWSLIGCTGMNTETCLAAPLKKLKQLEELYLSREDRSGSLPQGNPPRAGGAVCQALGANAKSFTAFTATAKIGINDAAMESLLRFKVTPSFSAVVSAVVEGSAASTTFLRHINIASCPNISDLTCMAIAATCPCLETLLVAGAAAISDFGAFAVLSHCRRLKQVSFRLCGGRMSPLLDLVMSDELDELVSPTPDMLDCDEPTRRQLRALPMQQSQHAWNVLCSRPEYRGRLRQSAFQEFIDHVRGVTMPPTGLGMDVTSMFMYLNAISDITAIAIAAHCPIMEDVDMSKPIGGVPEDEPFQPFRTMTGRQRSAWEVPTSSPHVKAPPPVRIPSPILTDLGAACVVMQCNFIKRLDLTCQALLTDHVLTLLSEHCPTLHTLILNGCHNISPRSLLYLCAVLPFSELSAKFFGLCPRKHLMVPFALFQKAKVAAGQSPVALQVPSMISRGKVDWAGWDVKRRAIQRDALRPGSNALHYRLLVQLRPDVPFGCVDVAYWRQFAPSLEWLHPMGRPVRGRWVNRLRPIDEWSPLGGAQPPQFRRIRDPTILEEKEEPGTDLAKASVQRNWLINSVMKEMRADPTIDEHRQMVEVAAEAGSILASAHTSESLKATALRKLRLQILTGSHEPVHAAPTTGSSASMKKKKKQPVAPKQPPVDATRFNMLPRFSSMLDAQPHAINEVYQAHKSAVILQRFVRGWVVRVLLARHQLTVAEAAASRIGKCVRATAVRVWIRRAVQKRHKGSTKISRCWRAYRCRILHRGLVVWDAVRHNTATRMKVWYHKRRCLWDMRQEVFRNRIAHLEMILHRAKSAARKIQAVWRMRLALMHSSSSRIAKVYAKMRRLVRLKAAVHQVIINCKIIQRIMRGALGRREAKERRAAVGVFMRLTAAALRIQKSWKCYRFNKLLKATLSVLRRVWTGRVAIDNIFRARKGMMYHGAASMIQVAWRSWKKRNACATRIQAAWRSYHVRWFFYLPLRQLCLSSITLIQRIYRRVMIRRFWRIIVNTASTQQSIRADALRSDAAIMVQRQYRLYRRNLQQAAAREAEVFLQRQLYATQRIADATEARNEKARQVNAKFYSIQLKRARDVERRNIRLHQLNRWLNRMLPASMQRPDQASSAMIYSLYKQQRLTYPPFGVVKLQVVRGETNNVAFAQQQEAARRINDRYFVQIPVSLAPISKDKSTAVYLWKQHATDPFVYSSIEPQLLTTRDSRTSVATGLIVPSPTLSSATLMLKLPTDGASCVQDVDVGVVGQESGLELEGKGYTPLAVDMAACGLRPDISIFVLLHRPYDHGEPSTEVHEKPYFDFRLQQVTDLLQLSVAQIEEMHDVYQTLTDKGMDSPTMGGILRFLELPDVPILRYAAAFLEFDGYIDQCPMDASKRVNKKYRGGITRVDFPHVMTAPVVSSECMVRFSEFVHMASTIILMTTPELIKYAISFGDSKRVLAVPEETALHLVADLLQAGPPAAPAAAIARQIRDAPRDSLGLVTSDTLYQVCQDHASLIYGLHQLQQALRKKLLGTTWWSAKQGTLAALRAAETSKRDRKTMELLAERSKPGATISSKYADGTVTAHPALPTGDTKAMADVLHLEMLALRSTLVRQIFVEYRRGQGFVAVCTVNTEPALEYARKHKLELGDASTDITKLCAHPSFRDMVLQSIRAEVGAPADVTYKGTIMAIHLSPQIFSTENDLLLPGAAVSSWNLTATRRGPENVQLLNREALRKRYNKVLDILYETSASAGAGSS